MKIFQFSYSLNPDIADSELVKSVQDQLANHSIDNYVKDHHDTSPFKEFAEKNGYVHTTKTYIVKNHDFFNTTDIVRFIRLKNNAFNIFQVDIDRDVRFTPKYFRDMIDVLGIRTGAFSFGETDVPEANKNIFKDYEVKDAKK